MIDSCCFFFFYMLLHALSVLLESDDVIGCNGLVGDQSGLQVLYKMCYANKSFIMKAIIKNALLQPQLQLVTYILKG